MALKQLTKTQADLKVGTNGSGSGVLYPAEGLQPWHTALINWLYSMDLSAVGDYQVREDDSAGTTVRILAGRATLNGVVLVYAGGTLSLSSYNNDTAYVWLQDNGSGSAQISAAADGTGWPAGNHLKLAEVTLASGAITAIVDRRHDLIFSDGSVAPGTTKSAFTVGLGSSAARLVLDNNSATGNYTAKLVPANLTGNRTIALPDASGTLALESFVAAAIRGLDYQDSVLDRNLSSPPGSPTTGDRYIVASGGSGAWSGHDDDIAEWDGSSWIFSEPNEGFTLRVEDENVILVHTGSSWTTLAAAPSTLDDVADGSTYIRLADVNPLSHKAQAGSIDSGIIAVSHLADAIKLEFVKHSLTVQTQGDTSTPSNVRIIMQDLAGTTAGYPQTLRVRVCDDAGYAAATNATIAAGASTTLLESITADKDLVLYSATGVFNVTLTNATAETVLVRIGQPPVTGRRGDYTTTLSVTHAAP